jgi:tight adherence protein B
VIADPRLLLGAFAGLVGLALGGVLLLQAQDGRERARARLLEASTPHIPDRAAAVSAVRSAPKAGVGEIGRRLLGLFGFNPDRQSRYPLRWWLVLAGTLLLARLAAGLGSAVIGRWAYLLLPAAWIWLSRSLFHWWERRYAERLFRQFPDALSMIIRAVRIGIPVTEAVHNLAREGPQPTAGEFKSVSEQITLGVPLDEALVQIANRSDLREYRFFATALTLQKQAGGGLTETLDNLADVIRRRVALRARARALTSEANTSSAILGAMPLVTGGALWLISPDYVYFLFDNPSGQRVLAMAVLLLGIGFGTIRYLIRRTLS